MRKHIRVQVDTAGAILDRVGLRWRYERRSKHPVLIVTDPQGGDHVLPLAGTPRSDATSMRNFSRQHAERLVRVLLPAVA